MPFSAPEVAISSHLHQIQLQEELLRRFCDQSIFAWQTAETNIDANDLFLCDNKSLGILAPSAKSFTYCRNVV